MKQYTKLLISMVMLVAAAVMVVATSFAWLTISDSPVMQGIQMTVSGGHTILVAPDVVQVVDGKTYHYPGAFSDNLSFVEADGYDYLNELAGLIPVSTADGETWYVPTYYETNDAEVLSGTKYVGQIKPTTEFIKDNMLTYANLKGENTDELLKGHYVYIDFWVVAPIDGYKLRVSTGDDGAGSYVIDLLDAEPVVVDGQVIYGMTGVNQHAAASMRVGFLINQDALVDDTMLLYSKSEGFNSSYSRLQGVYAETGSSALYSSATRFTIYEPNGDLHPAGYLTSNGMTVADGQYVLTEPLGIGGIATDIGDRLTVQLTNRWKLAENSGEPLISQMFQTFVAGKSLDRENGITLRDKFMEEWLQYQIHPYVNKGNFVGNTGDLYSVAGSDKLATSNELAHLAQNGATEDVFLTELQGGVPQRVRMFVWLEGQDVDCVNSAATGSFAISIELAGSNKK